MTETSRFKDVGAGNLVPAASISSTTSFHVKHSDTEAQIEYAQLLGRLQTDIEITDDTGEATTRLYALSSRRLVATSTSPFTVRRADNTGITASFNANLDTDTSSIVTSLAGQQGYVSQWTNQVSSGASFENSVTPLNDTQPLFVPYALNGRPALSFTSARYLFDNGAVLNSASNYTMQFVIKPNLDSGLQPIFLVRGASASEELYIAWRASDGRLGFLQNGTWQYTTVKPTAATMVLTFVFSSTNGTTVLVNGETVATGLTYTQTPLYTAMRFGVDFNGVGSTLLLGEAQIWSGAMSIALAKIEALAAMQYFGVGSASRYIQKTTPVAADTISGTDSVTGKPAEFLFNAFGGGDSFIPEETVKNPAKTYAINTAVADGTTNDYTVINAAINAAKTGNGGTVNFQSGTYAIGTQVTNTSISNVTFQGNGNSQLKKIGTPARILDWGLTDYPASTTVPQVQGMKFYGMNYLGLGTIAGNDANLINNSGNMNAFKKSFGTIFSGCQAIDIDNTFARFACTGEGDLFDDTGFVPVRIDASNFYMAGDRTASFTVGQYIAIANGVPTSTGNLEAVGKISTIAFDGTNTNVLLDFTGIGASLAAIPATTITRVGRMRTTSAFQGFNIIENHYSENTRQTITTNDTGSQCNVVNTAYLKDSGALKFTSKILDNKYHLVNQLFMNNCGERLLFQSSSGGIARDVISFGGAGVNGTPYGAITVYWNNEDILTHDINHFYFDGGISEGAYQGVYFIGQNNNIISEAIVANRFFSNVTATRSSSYGIVTANGRVKKLIIQNCMFTGHGNTIDAINLDIYALTADTHVEEIIIRDCIIEGGRYWLNLSQAAGSTRRLKKVTIDNVQVRGAKGWIIDGVDEVVITNTCNINYVAYDATAASTFNVRDSVISGRFSMDTGATSAYTFFPVAASTTNLTFDSVIIRCADVNVSGITCTGASVTDLRIINPDIVVGNDAVLLNGTGLTGALIGGKLTGGGSGTLYDLFVGSNTSSFEIRDVRYGTGNVSIDYTGVNNIKKFTWNPPSVASGSFQSTVVAFTGAAFGDNVTVTAPYDLQNLILSGYVSSAGNITVMLHNHRATAVDFPNSTGWIARLDKAI